LLPYCHLVPNLSSTFFFPASADTFCDDTGEKICSPDEITEDLVSHFSKNLKFTVKLGVKNQKQSSNFNMSFTVENSLNYAKSETVRIYFKDTLTNILVMMQLTGR